ncbi:MAG: hypothetical protein ACHP6H_04970 [Legionellales bacterium]
MFRQHHDTIGGSTPEGLVPLSNQAVDGGELVLEPVQSNASVTNSPGVFDRAYTKYVVTRFQSMQIITSELGLKVSFPISHQMDLAKSIDAVDGISSPHFFRNTNKKGQFKSSLEFEFIKKNDSWYLLFNCINYPDFIRYPLDTLLQIIQHSSVSSSKLFDASESVSVGLINLTRRERSVICTGGIPLSGAMLAALLGELENHEGDDLQTNWMPRGSIGKLTEALVGFVPALIPWRQ